MKTTLILAAGLAIGASAALAEAPAPSNVTFVDGMIEQPLTAEPGDATRGAEIMVTRSKGNCVACHEITALKHAPFHGEIGPMLDGIGEYRTPEELRGIVANAKMMFEDSVMPAFYKSSGFIRPGDAYTGKAGTEPLPPILTAQEVEDVVAFLLTLKDD